MVDAMKDTIVIVEDAPLYQDMLKNYVKTLGFSHKICRDGGEAIEFIKQNIEHITAVLLDIYLPNIDGISTLGHLRRKHPDLPIIVISGSDDLDDKRITLELGALQYFQKPLQFTGIPYDNTLGGCLTALKRAA